MRIVTILTIAALCFGCVATSATAGKSQPAIRGTLRLSVDVDGAEVYVDGMFWSNYGLRQGLGFMLASGLHAIVVRSPGYEPFETSVWISDSNSHFVIVRLTPSSGEQAARERGARAEALMRGDMGRLLVQANADAQVYIDGRPYARLGREGRMEYEVQCGHHRVVLKGPGYVDYSTEILVSPTNPNRVSAEMMEVAAPEAQ